MVATWEQSQGPALLFHQPASPLEMWFLLAGQLDTYFLSEVSQIVRTRRIIISISWCRVFASLVYDELFGKPSYLSGGVLESGRLFWHLLAT